MAIDSTAEVRRAGLARMVDDDGVSAIVGDRVFGQTARKAPDWPFIIWGSPTAVPVRATCIDGAEITVAVHGFARPRFDGDGLLVEYAEDHASRLGAAIAQALDGYRADIADGTAAFRWTGGQLLIDGGEADAFHTVQNFRIRCITNRAAA